MKHECTTIEEALRTERGEMENAAIDEMPERAK